MLLSLLCVYLTDVQIKSAYYLIWGQCHTILPLIQTTSSGKESGYSVILYQKEISYNRSENDPEEGWHIFVHPATDPWTGKKNDKIMNSRRVFTHASLFGNNIIFFFLYPGWLAHLIKLLKVVNRTVHLT